MFLKLLIPPLACMQVNTRSSKTVESLMFGKVAKPVKAMASKPSPPTPKPKTDVPIESYMKPALGVKGKKGTALGGKGKKGTIANVLRYGILCSEANCLYCSQFDDDTLASNKLTVNDIQWKDDTMKFVNLLWHPVPSEFKRIRAFNKMKNHLEEIHKLSGDNLPPLFRKGTQRMEETKMRNLSRISNRNNPSGQDL
jgi:hypothetical protein